MDIIDWMQDQGIEIKKKDGVSLFYSVYTFSIQDVIYDMFSCYDNNTLIINNKVYENDEIKDFINKLQGP